MVRHLSLLVAATTVLTSCFLVPQEEELLAPPLVEPPEVDYRTEPVQRGTITESVRVFGYFIAAQFEDLAFEERSGRLAEVHVRVGDTVQAGQLIAELHVEDISTQIRQAEIAIRRAELRLEIREADAERQLETAQLDLALSRERLAELEQSHQVEQAALGAVGEESAASLSTLRRQVNEQRVNVRKAELAVEQIADPSRSPEIELARLDVQAAQLHLDSLLADQEATKLVSPLSGEVVWVSSRAIRGEYFEALDRIVRIADPSELILEYSGRNATVFRVGMSCDVTIEDELYRGEVILTPRSAPYSQREELEETVRIRVTDLPPSVTSGDSARAQLILAQKRDVLVVPRRAVRNWASRSYVHVLVNGVQVERDIETGLETATEVEVISGLEEGEEILLR